MRQLMGNQPPPLTRPHGKPTLTKDDVATDRIGTRVHVPRRLLGGRAGMHAHSGKVVAEAPFHILPKRRIQRPARAGEDAVILERLSGASPGSSDDGFGSYLSTHPGLGERVERLEAGER